MADKFDQKYQELTSYININKFALDFYSEANNGSQKRPQIEIKEVNLANSRPESEIENNWQMWVAEGDEAQNKDQAPSDKDNLKLLEH